MRLPSSSLLPVKPLGQLITSSRVRLIDCDDIIRHLETFVKSLFVDRVTFWGYTIGMERG